MSNDTPAPTAEPSDEALIQHAIDRAIWKDRIAGVGDLAASNRATTDAHNARETLRARLAAKDEVIAAADAVNAALLKWLDENMDATPEQPEKMATLKRLSDIIHKYEEVRWPIGPKN